MIDKEAFKLQMNMLKINNFDRIYFSVYFGEVSEYHSLMIINVESCKLINIERSNLNYFFFQIALFSEQRTNLNSLY